ncbi:hypothetical protein AVEN_98324-1 [Araneus ventricosus]|uniref:Uncharacterized protein n=1 Tax=Araneus ventricosus TaxID=182803 RepID=A0A4Y2QV13_ARAVE|nr:hypothetical protein AVEN_98324-1 [Araneus ventricosus]
MQRISTSGSGGVVQCFGQLDRQTSLALITPVNSAGDLVARIAAAAGTSLVFSLTFDWFVRSASRPGDVISSTYFDDSSLTFLFNVLFSWFFCCTKNNKHVFSSYSCPVFLVFCVVPTAPGKRFRPCIAV